GGSGGGTGSAAAIPLDPALMSRCTGNNPIKCTFPVPANGNYTVTVELGSATAASTSRVQGEMFRIAIPPVSLPAGSFSQQTFSVNVREEKHDGYGAPGKELNVLIDGAAPALRGLGYAFTPDIPTVFVAGDSTVCDWEPTYAATKAGPLERGWAQALSQFFKASMSVANYADSGENSGGFYGKFWGPAEAALRPGDYVFVQFGHNDSGAALYKTNLMRYVNGARAKKATPVLFSPVGRSGASAANPGFGGLDQAARDLAAAENIAFIDLTKLSIAYYGSLPAKSVLFADGSHFNEYGATQISKLVTDQLRTMSLPIRDFLR
ncbi:MAG: hypothetical protein H7X95_06955, partial [Deltaproteobacteria bacterium]|nr:hypothetical protein [Deltaproteobacteria bacterium]